MVQKSYGFGRKKEGRNTRVFGFGSLERETSRAVTNKFCVSSRGRAAVKVSDESRRPTDDCLLPQKWPLLPSLSSPGPNGSEKKREREETS